MAWYALTLSEIESELGSDFKNGLGQSEAKDRLARDGWNALPEGKRENWISLFLRQFQSPLIYILLAAAGIVLLMGEIVDGSLILAVLFTNALIGALQEGKAENTLLALKKFAATTATVLREGDPRVIPEREIVPGDIIILHEGEKIPADARIIESAALKLDEAALTGEAKPIHKQALTLTRPDLPLMDQENMVFQGTSVVSGSGKAIVVSTGLNSYLGKISVEIARINTEIPLKKDIRRLSQILVWVISVLSILLFGIGVATGRSMREMFAVTVSLAVSIIPEGLPIILTLILASGVWRMAKRNALVKKLQAVEALGQASVIAVDKTGTLTRNELVIRQVYTSGKWFEISGSGYEPKGQILLDKKPVAPGNHPELILAGKIATLCANARAFYWEESKSWKVSGDPTEAAMFVLGAKLGFDKDDLEREMPLLMEIPFDYKLKYHLTSHESGPKKQFVTVAGAPEKVLELVKRAYLAGRAEILSANQREEIESAFHKMSREGLRVVAFGYEEATVSDKKENLDFRNFIFAGFFGMEDSLRPEVPDAMARARAAGIRVVMITGDARLTALAIAKEAGIWREGDEAMTDQDLEKLSPIALSKKLENVTVFARITPEHKMKIIQAYRKSGKIVAMTGDGVNDAPSLVAADLGVAMGKIGTEVAKEAADIVLLDDNFGSIVSAIEEGRSMYATIQKTLLFLFSTSLGELLVIGGAISMGWPLPLLAPQILWLNLVTDSVVAFALALDAKETGLLNQEFRRSKFLMDSETLWRMFLMAMPITLGSLYAFQLMYPLDMMKAWTITLTLLAAFQWMNGWNCRSARESVFETNPFANRFLVLGVFAAVSLQVFAVYSPFMQKVLRIVPLTWQEWLWTFTLAFSIIIVEEIRKTIHRRRSKLPDFMHEPAPLPAQTGAN